MDKPSIEQIAWLFKHLSDHLDQGGNFAKMIERLELPLEAYPRLMEAGGVEVVNILDWASKIQNMVDTIADDFEIEFTPEKPKEPNKPN